MDLDALRDSPVGLLVPIKGTDAVHGEYEYFAYLPDHLPEAPLIGPTTWSAVVNAAHALGRLRQACAQLPNPQILIRPALAREALDTSALEGTYAPLSEVLEARLPRSDAASPEVAEIRAYEQIASKAFAWVRERPITMGMLSELQGTLVKHNRRPTRDPGRVRAHQVLIGPEGSPLPEARFVPPPPDDRLTAGLEAWQAWIQREDSPLPIVLRAALAHYQFESLHPFGDGNGRVGRLVIVLQLLRDGSLPEPALTLSPWLLRRRDDYQRLLLRVSQTGDWDSWVSFFCQGLCAQAERSVQLADQLTAWQAYVRQQLQARHWTGTINSLAESLIEWPVITVAFTAEKFDVSFPTAKSAVDRLVEIGVLKEMTGRRYGRVFGAVAVMDIVESM